MPTKKIEHKDLKAEAAGSMADNANKGKLAPFAPKEDEDFSNNRGEILSLASWDVFMDLDVDYPEIYDKAAGACLWDDETNNPAPPHLRPEYRSPIPEPVTKAQAHSPQAPEPASSGQAMTFSEHDEDSVVESSVQTADSSDEDELAHMSDLHNDDSQDDDFQPDTRKRGRCGGSTPGTGCGRGRPRGSGISRGGGGGVRLAVYHQLQAQSFAQPLAPHPNNMLRQPTQMERKSFEANHALPLSPAFSELSDNEMLHKEATRLGKRVVRDDAAPPRIESAGIEELHRAGVRLGTRVATDGAEPESSNKRLLTTEAREQSEALQIPNQANSGCLQEQQVRAWDLQQKIEELQAVPQVSGEYWNSQTLLQDAMREYDEHVATTGVPVPRERPLSIESTYEVLTCQAELATAKDKVEMEQVTLERAQDLLNELMGNPAKFEADRLPHLRGFRESRVRNSNCRIDKLTKTVRVMEDRYAVEYQRVYDVPLSAPVPLPVLWKAAARLSARDANMKKKMTAQQARYTKQAKNNNLINTEMLSQATNFSPESQATVEAFSQQGLPESQARAQAQAQAEDAQAGSSVAQPVKFTFRPQVYSNSQFVVSQAAVQEEAQAEAEWVRQSAAPPLNFRGLSRNRTIAREQTNAGVEPGAQEDDMDSSV
ncbi:unnamed protein product [Discula destructiva]